MGRKFGFSFSWKRALGLSAAKGKISRAIGIPLTKSGRQRKAGRLLGNLAGSALIAGTEFAKRSGSASAALPAQAREERARQGLPAFKPLEVFFEEASRPNYVYVCPACGGEVDCVRVSRTCVWFQFLLGLGLVVFFKLGLLAGLLGESYALLDRVVFIIGIFIMIWSIVLMVLPKTQWQPWQCGTCAARYRGPANAHSADDYSRSADEEKSTEPPRGSLDKVGIDAAERRLHDDARRFARLLVEEIIAYNEEKVIEGRLESDLYERLREYIDVSREMYDKRVKPEVTTRYDYFYHELVNTLAEGDPLKLGDAYFRRDATRDMAQPQTADDSKPLLVGVSRFTDISAEVKATLDWNSVASDNSASLEELLKNL